MTRSSVKKMITKRLVEDVVKGKGKGSQIHPVYPTHKQMFSIFIAYYEGVGIKNDSNVTLYVTLSTT